MSRIKECMRYVKNWYVDGAVVTVRMDASNEMDELCIQTMVAELLRDFIDNPIPEGMNEGSPELNQWVETALRKVMFGLDFGFADQQREQIKNLAFNYWAQGTNQVVNDPALRARVYKCYRQQQMRH